MKNDIKDFEAFVIYQKIFEGKGLSKFADIYTLKYRKLPVEQKLKLIEALKEKVQSANGIVFAYIHGSFVKRDSFRDLDIAVWIKRREEAFYYTVDFSAKLETEMKLPIDVQVLNEAPLPFKHEVFTTGRLLFSSDESFRLKVVDEVIKQYMDLKSLKRYGTVTHPRQNP